MKIYTLKKKQWVSRSIEEVFNFFKRPENLEKITPSSLGFEILTPKPIQMEKGRLIDYSIKIMGIHQRWTTLITDYRPPNFFVDEQIKGPYDFWHHMHRFEESKGGTLILDEVRYSLPFGFLGKIAHHFFVKRKLKQIFDYREQVIENYFKDKPEKAGIEKIYDGV